MNELQPYKSQIQKTDIGYEVKINSQLKKLSDSISPISIITTVFIMIVGALTVQFVAQIAFLLLFIQGFIFTIKDAFFSNVLINATQIQQGSNSFILQGISYLDLEIKSVQNVTKVAINNIHFELDNVSDVAVLTDVLLELTSLEFYENRKLDATTEVLTFKSKYFTKPNFATFLNIEKTPKKIRIYDMTNQFSWFEVRKKNATHIHYSTLANNDQINQTIAISMIQIISIRIRSNRIEVIVNNTTFIFQSSFRKRVGRLTNLRDGEKIYEILKNLPYLSNIKIEKVILH